MDLKQQCGTGERSDLLLIKPLTRYDVQGIPPLGLGFISAAVKKAGFTSTILDCNVRSITAEQLPAATDLNAYGLIGIQAFYNDLPEVLKYLRMIKTHAPHVPVIVGGAAPASDPDYVFKFLGDPDFLCVGEGEHTVCALLERIRKGPCLPSDLEHIPNLCWRGKDGLHLSRHEYIDNLDEIGSPDWEGIDPGLYPNAVLGSFYRRSPVMPIFTSRGCPFRCNYCGGRLITGYKVRRRSPGSVVEELAWLKEHCGIREFQIADDNFTSSAREALAFVRELKARKLDLLWTCPCGLRLDSLDRELLEAMKDAGCYEVAVGIESGDPRILRAMNKNSSPEKVEAMIRLIDEVGIRVVGLIIVGYPGETKESLLRTMNYVLRLPMVRVSLTRFFPIRGTAVTEELLGRGEIKEEDLDPARQNEGKYTYLTPELDEKTLRSLYRTFFLRFLLRPKIIWHTLRSMRSFSHIKFLFRRVLAYLK